MKTKNFSTFSLIAENENLSSEFRDQMNRTNSALVFSVGVTSEGKLTLAATEKASIEFIRFICTELLNQLK